MEFVKYIKDGDISNITLLIVVVIYLLRLFISSQNTQREKEDTSQLSIKAITDLGTNYTTFLQTWFSQMIVEQRTLVTLVREQNLTASGLSKQIDDTEMNILKEIKENTKEILKELSDVNITHRNTRKEEFSVLKTDLETLFNKIGEKNNG